MSEFRQLEKFAAKERKMAEKLAEKERKKAEILAAKEREKAEKLAAKEREKAEKLREKEREKAEKLAMKIAIERAKKHGLQKGIRLEKQKQQKKLIREEANYEIKKESIARLVQVAEQLQEEYPNQGLSISCIVNKYIEIHGEINPYTIEPVEEGYDLHAAIRGLVYESSPSSQQHWFRYGVRKTSRQICPWVFANKTLANINNDFDWRKTTNEMSREKRENIGKWKVIVEPNAWLNWKPQKYGPLPRDEQLDNDEQRRERIQGTRGRSL